MCVHVFIQDDEYVRYASQTTVPRPLRYSQPDHHHALEHFRNVERENLPTDLFRRGDERIVHNLSLFGSQRNSEHIRTGIQEIAHVSEIEPGPQDTSLSAGGSSSETLKNDSLQIRVRRPDMLVLDVEVLAARPSSPVLRRSIHFSRRKAERRKR